MNAFLRQLDDPTQRLLWVVTALALSLLPHVANVPIWIVLFAAVTAAWRIAAQVRGWKLPPKWLRIVVVVLAVVSVLAGYRTLNGLEAGTALLVLMAASKLLETRDRRDLTVLLFISFVLLFAALLYEQGLMQLPYMLVAVWLLTATLMRVHQTTSRMPMREAMRMTAKMLLLSLPVAVAFFLLFPRLPGQFWALPARAGATSGINDEISPGDVSELSLSSGIAFRVTFTGSPPPPAERYWRGVVLHDFDGRTWRRPRGRFSTTPTVEPSGQEYDYRVTLEPNNRNWLFSLDLPTRWPTTRAFQSYDFQLLSAETISSPTSYRVRSHTQYTMTSELPMMQRNMDTALPGERNPRTRELARTLRAEHPDAVEFVQAVLQKFRNEEYFYTLEPPRLEADSVDDFLFNTRRGFCEHFASAFTALMRAGGVPARIVAGYQGGQYNPMGDYLIVRQSDAHAWSEVWIEGRGWVRVDPTAAVAPERIEQGLDAAVPEDEPVPGRMFGGNRMVLNLQLAWDALNSAWQNNVVEYDDTLQRSLFSTLGFDDVDWRSLGLLLTASLAAFFVALSAWLAWRFKPRMQDPAAQAYAQLCRKLGSGNLPRRPHEGPVDYLTRVGVARPELRADLDELRALYVSLRYGPLPMSAQLSRFRFLVNRLKL